MNSLKHGITAKTLILQNENPDHFKEMMDAYIAHLKPQSQVEIDLVSDLVAARWRLRRIWRYETALLDIEMDALAPDFNRRYTKHDEDMRGSLAFSSLAESKGFSTVLRYEAHFNRVFRRTLAQLKETKSAKRNDI